jgi:hypothetical protein
VLEAFAHSAKIGRPAVAFQRRDEPNRNASCEDSIMASKALPSPEVLRQLLRYEPETGKLFWRERGAEWFSDGADGGAEASARRWNSRLAGREAFLSLVQGYPSGTVFDRRHHAHRVIWAMQTGRWPDGEIDHINHTLTDNRWVNLRGVSRGENQKNYPMPSSNKSGVMGVHWCKASNRWVASIRNGREKIRIGGFIDFEAAVRARRAAEDLLGFHPNHGKAS